jgi:hypothetical protein
MLRNGYESFLRGAFRLSAWVRYNRCLSAPVLPDEIIEVNPQDISEKTLTKPRISRLINTAIVDGDWDVAVGNVEEDVVYQAFNSHFVGGADWLDTGYVDYLQGGASEHGRSSVEVILQRCSKLDELFCFIRDNGYKTQRALQSESAVILGSWKHQLIPPEFREISVNVTRDGKFLWHGGFHRLCIARILELEAIPVRVTVRHARWQQIRDDVASGREYSGKYDFHPDVRNVLQRRAADQTSLDDD